MTDQKTPLSPEQYATGQQVKSPDGDAMKIVGSLRGGDGNVHLLVAAPDGYVAGLVLESVIRDQFDWVDPESVQEAPPADAAPEDGTDGTGGTGSQG